MCDLQQPKTQTLFTTQAVRIEAGNASPLSRQSPLDEPEVIQLDRRLAALVRTFDGAVESKPESSQPSVRRGHENAQNLTTRYSPQRTSRDTMP